MAPANAKDMHELLNTAYQYPGPALVRYPRDNTDKPPQIDTNNTAELGKGIVVRQGNGTALLVFGTLLDIASEVAEVFDLTVVNMRFIKPLDGVLIEQLAASHDNFVTIEDGTIVGGAGSAVLEFLSSTQLKNPCLRLGLDDRFPSQGNRQQVLAEYGMDREGIKAAIQGFIQP